MTDGIKEIVEAEDGYEIQVGDVIESKDAFYGSRQYDVHRVTKNYSFVKYNDIAEGKFPRIYKTFGFTSLPRHQWSTINYTVYTKKQ